MRAHLPILPILIPFAAALLQMACTRLAWQRELERLRSQVAAGTVAVLEQERQIGQERAAGSRTTSRSSRAAHR